MLELAAHWRTLGYEVPTFEINAEPIDGSIRLWQAGAVTNLTEPPYELVEIFE